MATAEILGCLLCVAVVLIKCAPAPAPGVSHELDADGDGDGGDGDIIPYDAPDIDSQQLRGRYDARLLSENVSGYQYQSADADEEATSCRNANAKYVHGQKVPRSDPCEICLCVDGEIFCWWKKCDHLLKKFAQLIKHRRKSALAQRKRKKTATAKTSSSSAFSTSSKASTQSDRLRDWQQHHSHNDKSDGIPSNVRNFPQHLAPHFHGTGGSSSVDDSAADMSDDDVATIARPGRPEIEANIKSGRHPAPTSTSTFPASPSSSSSPIDGNGNGNHYQLKHSNNAVAAMRSGPESALGSGSGAVRSTPNGEQSQPQYNGERAQDDNSNEDQHRPVPYFNQHADDSKVWRDVAVSGEIIIDDKIVQSLPSANRSGGVFANDDDQQQQQQQSSESVATSISAYSVLPPASPSSATPMVEERGYYEKTIFNKNGVFIENIRKIGNLEADNGAGEKGGGGGRNGKHVEGGGGVDDDDDNVQRKVILNAQTSVVVGAGSAVAAAAAALSVDGIGGGSGRGDKLMRSGGRDLVVVGAGDGGTGDGGGDVDEDADAEAADEAAAADEDEARERQKIALMSVPLSEHYVITSSGRIAKTADALASDDVISQFREGLAGAGGNGGGGSDDQTPSTAADAPDDIGASMGAAIMQTQSAATGTRAGGGGGGAQLSSTVRVVKQMPSAVDHRTTKGPAQPMLSGSDAVSIQPMCIVMGKSYVVGTVLPQEAGNCLQCVCTSGTPEDVSPRVTCSSHNCPPLILPDLFDATGY